VKPSRELKGLPVALPSAGGPLGIEMIAARCRELGDHWAMMRDWTSPKLEDRLRYLDEELAALLTRCPVRSVSETSCAPCDNEGTPVTPCPCSEQWVHSWLICESI